MRSGTACQVVFWGPKALEINELLLYTTMNRQATIMLVVGLIVKRHNNVSRLLGARQCRWYLNPDIPEAIALQGRYWI
uniref:Uncharacterized protein n=1 Tax=Arundo donax TaxID=35708 RepID=A0A0A9FYT3_ARUDO